VDGHDQHLLLRAVGLSVVGAAVAALPAYLLRMPLMLAYLAAGVALGPHLGLGLIVKAENISEISSIGLVLLMFILGLEIDVKKLLQAGKAVITNGITQFAGCVTLGLGVFYLCGYRNGDGTFELLYLAVACGLSSTLIVVKLLSDRMELDTLTSRISLGILVLQDLWAIAFLAVQPNLNNLQPAVLGISAGKAVLLVATSLVASKYILPPIFARASRQPELLLVVAMGWCFAMCGLADKLNLSLEMGALTAGIGIASFPYHTDVAAKVSSLRDFFITLFFVALGLQIPVPTPEILKLTAIIVLFVLVSRVLTVFPVLYALRYGNRASLVPGLNISQVSEFALVLCTLGVEHKHISQDTLSAFILGLVATALLSSIIIPKSHNIYRALQPLLEKIGFKDKVLSSGQTQVTDAVHADHPQIVLLGFFREASSLLKELANRHPADVMRKVLVVDFNPEAHKKLSDAGFHCKFGDLSHPDTLKHLDLDAAKVLVCTIPDHILKGTSNLGLLKALKHLAPDAQIILTAETLQSAREMYESGADYVFIPRLLSATYLADLLDHIHAGTDAAFKEASRKRLKEWQEVLG
jgi:Kef-type K+ transport system membrane component KefB